VAKSIYQNERSFAGGHVGKGCVKRGGAGKSRFGNEAHPVPNSPSKKGKWKEIFGSHTDLVEKKTGPKKGPNRSGKGGRKRKILSVDGKSHHIAQKVARHGGAGNEN